MKEVALAYALKGPQAEGGSAGPAGHTAKGEPDSDGFQPRTSRVWDAQWEGRARGSHTDQLSTPVSQVGSTRG